MRLTEVTQKRGSQRLPRGGLGHWFASLHSGLMSEMAERYVSSQGFQNCVAGIH